MAVSKKICCLVFRTSQFEWVTESLGNTREGLPARDAKNPGPRSPVHDRLAQSYYVDNGQLISTRTQPKIRSDPLIEGSKRARLLVNVTPTTTLVRLMQENAIHDILQSNYVEQG